MPNPRPTTRLSTKGQVILPADLRKKHGWAPGQVLEVQETPDGILLKPANPFAPTAAGAAFGMLHEAGRPAVTLEQMNASIADEARARHARGRY